MPLKIRCDGQEFTLFFKKLTKNIDIPLNVFKKMEMKLITLYIIEIKFYI